MNKEELTITGLTPNQKFICEILWKMPSMHAVEDLSLIHISEPTRPY